MPTQPSANGKRKVTAERSAKADVGRHAEQQLVGVRRTEVFLGDQLDAVGQGLQPAEAAADAGRAEPILDPAGDLPLQPDEDQRTDRHHVQ